MNSNIRQQLILGNLLMLLVVACLWVITDIRTHTYINWIYRPGGYLLALAICSTTTFYFLSPRSVLNLKGWLVQLRNGVVFALCWMILSDLLILVLERFFRFEEHLLFETLPERWWNSYDRWGWGILLYFGYWFVGKSILENSEIKAYQQSLSEMRQELSSVNLLSLRRELNPHFLHNAMNSIAMMIRIRKYEEAVNMIANLNELLRVALNKDREVLVPLSDELHLLDQYLKIEMVRFGDRVQLERDIHTDAMDALVPQLMLQPIVENAFKHGMQRSLHKQELLIKGTISEGYLVFSIMNTSPTVKSALYDSSPQSIGWKNTTDRLRYLYGNDFKFQILQLPEGFNVKITIPLQWKKSSAS